MAEQKYVEEISEEEKEKLLNLRADNPTEFVNPLTMREIRRLPALQGLKFPQVKFAAAMYRTNLKVEPAARLCFVDWQRHYAWLKKDEKYRAAIDFIRDMVGDKLESSMMSDAVDGRLTPIVYQGKITGTMREINPQERIALLKGLRPQYRDGQLINNTSGPVQVAIVLASDKNSLTNESKLEPEPKKINS